MTNLQKIAKWFRNHKNDYATFAEICKAFPGIKPKTISSVLCTKTKDPNGNPHYVFIAKGTRGHYKYLLNPNLPIYEEVENFSDPEEVEIEKMPADKFFANVDPSCEGDCSHCTASTCVSKDEAETSEKPVEEKTLGYLLEVLRSIDKHLAQIAEAETSVAKLFH